MADTDVLGLTDQRVALAGEILQQTAHPHLVVVIGAFKRPDLVLHQRFKLARAGQRALDPVAHGRDLAADGLSDGHDRIPRHALGLGETHGDPRHRLRDQAQFLRAQAMWATPKKKMIGSSAAAPRPIMRAMGERPGPSAALMSERYANESERQPTIQAQENAVATKYDERAGRCWSACRIWPIDR